MKRQSGYLLCYHGTHTGVLQDILQNGLSNTPPFQSTEGEEEEGTQTHTGVYLTNNVEAAFYYAENASFKFGTDSVILELVFDTEDPQATFSENELHAMIEQLTQGDSKEEIISNVWNFFSRYSGLETSRIQEISKIYEENYDRRNKEGYYSYEINDLSHSDVSRILDILKGQVEWLSVFRSEQLDPNSFGLPDVTQSGAKEFSAENFLVRDKIPASRIKSYVILKHNEKPQFFGKVSPVLIEGVRQALKRKKEQLKIYEQLGFEYNPIFSSKTQYKLIRLANKLVHARKRTQAQTDGNREAFDQYFPEGDSDRKMFEPQDAQTFSWGDQEVSVPSTNQAREQLEKARSKIERLREDFNKKKPQLLKAKHRGLQLL